MDPTSVRCIVPINHFVGLWLLFKTCHVIKEFYTVCVSCSGLTTEQKSQGEAENGMEGMGDSCWLDVKKSNAGVKGWSFQNICTTKQPNSALLIDTRGQGRMAKLVLRWQRGNSNSKSLPKKAVKPSRGLQKTICQHTTRRILKQTVSSRTGRFRQNGQSEV